MQGFDSSFKDFPGYILDITKEIWENRGIATLHDYCSEDIVVRMPGSVSTGNQNVIAATMATLAEFPDRTLLGEDVIWSGSPEEGMLSSHRILSTATHLGEGAYGKPTGKPLVYRILADCHAINNKINDEWLIRDQGAILRQMGWEPKAFAADLIEREGGIDNCVKPLTPETDIEGPYLGTGNDNRWGEAYAGNLRSIMAADLRVIEHNYDRAVQTEYPGGATGHSYASVDHFWMGLRAAFPNAQFTIHHQIGRDDPLMPPRASIRWSLWGKHEGYGAFGPPTGAMVYVMGISQAEYGALTNSEAKIRREYTLFDEAAIWKQILLQTK
ncbi:ester cyclase [Polycladidibacter hongkongensis]|uniref:nuclear transport factor 2 family protein n=1 Tax=Polycladidibacter hongkongensis TaxID=1647556 RepID=UPI00082D3930|nr:ester cyclase [Pseudovibrio hongkongensis]